ncbi:MAG: AI-2E family transporter [Myxococcaceae bacterium]|nr:AI-2E family transporter [Myxococcaceae bacterium]
MSEGGPVERGDAQKRWSNVVFAVLFFVSLALFGRIMAPFLEPVLLGAFLVVLLMPIHDWICRRSGNRRALCAGITTVTVLLLIVIPLATIIFLVGREVMAAADHVRGSIESPDFRARLADRLPGIARRWVMPAATDAQADGQAMAVMAGGASVLRDVLGAGTALAIDGFLMAVAMYYFFLDGRRLWRELGRLIPMERRYLDAFAKEFRDVAFAIVYGNSLTALIQGAVGLIGLTIAGVPHALVWGVAMAVVAMIPIGGTALVWLPIGVVLVFTGHTAAGIFLLVWGALVVSTIDNFIRPRLCGSRMALHPLLVFLSMFGGIAVFGIIGLILGPLIAAIFMAMVRIYRRDFIGTARGSVDRLSRTMSPERPHGAQT